MSRTKSFPPQTQTQTQTRPQPLFKISLSPLLLPSTPSLTYDSSVPLFNRFDGAWADTISNHSGGPSLSSPNKNTFVSFICFRCTSPSITAEIWEQFKERCEKLMVMQWEHEAGEGADPEDMRRFFKIGWVEDVQDIHVDLGFLKEKFQAIISDLKSRHQQHEGKNILNPSLNAFLYINDAAISSLLSPSSGEIPFVNAVNPGYDGDPMNPKAHCKIAIELLGHFWCLVGTGEMGMEELMSRVGEVCRVVGEDVLYEGEVMGRVKEGLLER